MACRVAVPQLDAADVARLLEGLPAVHFPLHWVQADGWRGAPAEDGAEPSIAVPAAGGGSGSGGSSVRQPAPAKVRRSGPRPAPLLPSGATRLHLACCARGAMPV